MPNSNHLPKPAFKHNFSIQTIIYTMHFISKKKKKNSPNFTLASTQSHIICLEQHKSIFIPKNMNQIKSPSFKHLQHPYTNIHQISNILSLLYQVNVQTSQICASQDKQVNQMGVSENACGVSTNT